MGHSDFASFNEDGTKVDYPVFPFSIRYEPNPELSYEDTTYEKTYFERLSEIEPNTMLFKVWAMDKPASLGGTESLIGEVQLVSELVTSKWGDEHMYFRHQRADDDFRYQQDWSTAVDVAAMLLEGEEIEIKPYQTQRYSSCPLSWLFQ